MNSIVYIYGSFRMNERDDFHIIKKKNKKNVNHVFDRKEKPILLTYYIVV